MNLPREDQHLVISGQNGSGKTVAALWHLSMRDYHVKPWIIFDFKGDENIGQLPGLEQISPKANIDKLKSGLFVVRPVPGIDDKEVENLMWKMHRRERVGGYVDEGYMVKRNNPAFTALLTQGRAKNIPFITLTQRPVYLNPFVVSEAGVHQVYFMSDRRDRETVQEYVPYDIMERLPRYHSYYYNVGDDEFGIMKPVPKPSQILQRFHDRAKNRLRAL